jgi:hypothetical protein
MTLDDLIAETRYRAKDDVAASYLISDAQLLAYANEAVLEACERAPLLYDDTSAFCTIATAIADATYSLDASIRTVDRMRLASTGNDVTQMSEEGMYRRYGRNWQTATGTPVHYIRHKTALLIYPIPDAIDALNLAVYRRPLSTELMTIALRATVGPIISAQYHMDLVYWMLYRYYAVRDADIVEAGANENKNLALFEARFGQRKTARHDAFTQDFPGGYALPLIGVR